MPSIYFLALEPSGDSLGAGLMHALREETNGRIEFVGVGGEKMKSLGFDSIFDPKELSILGIFEVLPNLFTIVKRLNDVFKDIDIKQPDVIVSIDSWGFTGFIHKKLSKKNSSIRRLRYVAPQVWAWRPGRAKKLAGWIHHLLTLFPFEPQLFEKYGLKSTYVGHPVFALRQSSGNAKKFKKYNNIPDNDIILGIFPGSRFSEVERLCPIFSKTISRLSDNYSNLRIIIPTIPSLESFVRTWASKLKVPNHIVIKESEKENALAAMQVALAASGTVTLELARAKIPHVVAYKVNHLSAFFYKRLSIIKNVNLINIILEKEIIPELLQSNCNDIELSKQILNLFNDKSKYNRQIKCFEDLLDKLSIKKNSPSQLAARAVLEEVSEN